MVIQRISVIAALFTLVFANTGFTEEATRAKDYAFFKDTTIWPSLDIKVCWERQTDPKWNNTKVNRKLVQDAVERTWQKASLVRFIGWGWCPTGYFDGVRISMGELPLSHGLGTEVLNIHPKTGMRGLTLDFKLETTLILPTNAPPLTTFKKECRKNGKSLKECIEFTAVHEFGHILGLSHEQNRRDDIFTSPCHFDDPLSDNVHGNTYFTEYDPDSIMNYCRQKYYGDSNLSKMDEFAVKVYYGRIPSYGEDTGVLEIPRVMVSGRPYKASMVISSKGFRLLSAIPIGNSRKDQSAIRTIYYHPFVDLPMVRSTRNGRVVNIFRARLKNVGNGIFSVVTAEEHPCKRPQPNSFDCYQ